MGFLPTVQDLKASPRKRLAYGKVAFWLVYGAFVVATDNLDSVVFVFILGWLSAIDTSYTDVDAVENCPIHTCTCNPQRPPTVCGDDGTASDDE